MLGRGETGNPSQSHAHPGTAEGAQLENDRVDVIDVDSLTHDFVDLYTTEVDEEKRRVDTE